MGEVVPLPVKPRKPRRRFDTKSLEACLKRSEVILPYLRKHVRELAENPTDLHFAQVRASLDSLHLALAQLNYFLFEDKRWRQKILLLLLLQLLLV